MADESRIDRPSFLELWFEALRDDVSTKGARAAVPYWLALFLGIAIAATYGVSTEKVLLEPSITATLYGGILALDALLLALSWSAFSRIYDAMFAPGFYDFLRRNRMLNTYLFHIGYIHVAQMAAVIATGGALIISLMVMMPVLVHQAAFCGSLFFSSYALRQASGSVTLMHDIVWYKALYAQQNSAAPAPNVAPLRKP